VQERYLPENLPFHYSTIAIRATRCRSDAPKIFGSAGALPSRKLATRHSLSFHLHDLPMT